MRALLFDDQGLEQEHYGLQIPYEPRKTPDGGVEVDADFLRGLCEQALDALHRQMESDGLRAAGAAMSAFWHSFLGVDAAGAPATPLIHLFDTRSTAQVERLKQQVDADAQHRRTGCLLHTSYWPAKLLFLADTQPDAVARTRHWWSLGEYLYSRWLGQPRSSESMVSGSGIWHQWRHAYDAEMLALLPVRAEMLARPEDLDHPAQGLLPAYRQRWPLFADMPWFPALGDGACNNLGSGCVTGKRFALMVGTSGAMRTVLVDGAVEPPAGLWSYRADRRRQILGGAISNGGQVYAWWQAALDLPDESVLDSQLAAMQPGAHGLTVLPFFAGERAPYWRADLRAAVIGMSLATKPIDLLRASLESVALRFRQIYRLMTARTGEPEEVVASGGALLHSRAWTQMMADALGRPVVACAEAEASSRGAALWAWERLGRGTLESAPLRTSGVVEPRPQYAAVYDEMLAAQTRLYEKLY